jgi:glutamine synthetase
MNSAGSAAHTHISVHSGRVKKDVQLSSVEKSFLAGVMAHLPSLPAITLPIPASYKRVSDGVWSGGTYVSWGTENREAPVRLTNSASPSSRRFEMRFIDGTANPHLVLAGILSAGYLGIQSNLELTISDCPGPKSAAQMSEDERQALGIYKRMPLSWNEARENFVSDTQLSKMLGTEFQEKYLSVNKVRVFL